MRWANSRPSTRRRRRRCQKRIPYRARRRSRRRFTPGMRRLSHCGQCRRRPSRAFSKPARTASKRGPARWWTWLTPRPRCPNRRACAMWNCRARRTNCGRPPPSPANGPGVWRRLTPNAAFARCTGHWVGRSSSSGRTTSRLRSTRRRVEISSRRLRRAIQ